MPSPTPIAFVTKDSGAVAIPNASSETTASLTWQTGDILVLLVNGSGAATGNTFQAPTNTGSGITWTQKQLHVAASDTEIGAWTSVATANSSGTVTITMNTTGNDAVQIGVFQWRAPSGYTIAVGNTALATGKTTTQHVVGLLVSSADSAICWAASDWSAPATLETPTPTPTTHSTSSPGPSALPYALNSNGNNTGYLDVLDDQVTTGTVNYGTTGTTGGPVAIVAVEVTISGGGVALPEPFIPTRMPLGC
jgi:hypothetical protein